MAGPAASGGDPSLLAGSCRPLGLQRKLPPLPPESGGRGSLYCPRQAGRVVLCLMKKTGSGYWREYLFARPLRNVWHVFDGLFVLRGKKNYSVRE